MIGAIDRTSDALADLRAVISHLRVFGREHPQLTELMFGCPFARFDPDPAGVEAGAPVRGQIVAVTQRCIDVPALSGDAPTSRTPSWRRRAA